MRNLTFRRCDSSGSTAEHVAATIRKRLAAGERVLHCWLSQLVVGHPARTLKLMPKMMICINPLGDSPFAPHTGPA